MPRRRPTAGEAEPSPVAPASDSIALSARLAAIVSTADDAIVSKTLDGIVTSWNRAAERLFGYAAEEAIGRSITLIIPPERLHEEVVIVDRLRQGLTIDHFETERVRKDGRRISISLSVSPILDADGRVIGAAKIARDIGERLRAEAELKRTAQTLTALYHLADGVGRARTLTEVCDAAVDAIMAGGADRVSVLLLDEDGVMRFQAWRGLSDRYRAAVEGHSPWSADAENPAPIFVEDAGVDPAMEPLRRVLEAEGIRALAFVPLVQHGRLLGKFMTYHDSPRAMSDAERRFVTTVAQHVAFGVARVRAEAAFQALYDDARRQQRESELVAELTQRMNASLDLPTTLERLLAGARDLCDGDIARIVLRDPATGRMLLRHRLGTRWPGYHDGTTVEPGEGSGGFVLVTGKPFRTDDYTRDPRITPHYVEAARKDGTITQLVVPIPGDREIGGLLYVDRTTSRPFSDRDEAVMVRLANVAAGAIHNSQLFEAEQASRAEADVANRSKDRFLAILSHELRTPLNAILGWARLLRRGRLAEDQRTHAVDVIERNAALQAQLVSDLLDLSSIAAGKTEIERVPLDLGLVVRQTIETVAADVEAKNLTLLVDVDVSAGDVEGDELRLQQVVGNLLSNAIKFTPPGGTVQVRLLRHETSVRVIVSDTGEGIEPAALARIFHPFEQGDASTTRTHKGLGLGLAIVRQLVELHGGRVWAESAGRGRGAAFTIDLPVVAVKRVPSRAVAPVSPSPLEGRRLLVVDDQADARDLVALVLHRSGATVHAAASAREALDLLGKHDVDALVSDISMPDVDGFGLIAAVRARERARGATPVRAIAFTAHIGQEIRDRALAAGFDLVATKPLDPDTIVEQISRLLE